MDDDKSQTDTSKGQFDPLAKKKKVGNYLLGKVIGEGSFSKIRQGIHIIAREKIAVKIVPKKAVLLRDYVKRGVRREAVLLQKLDHPNIVRLYEIMETENSYYLVLELAESGDFIKYLSEKKFLEETECQKYIRQMTSALDHMHTSNITHRDLKLENLLLDKENDLKIVDFGFSNVFYGDTSLSTQCGSPVYAAPEIFCNKKYGPAVDVWSMGICMYAMLTGRLPFMPEPPTNLTLLHALILRGPLIPDTLSEGCTHLLSKMLTIDVHYRIRVDDILRHRWVLENHDTPLITRQPTIGKLYPHIPKAPVVNYMTNVFTFLEDDIFYSVMERKMNAVAATYHLLQKRFDAGHLLMGSFSLKKIPFALPNSSNTHDPNVHSLDKRDDLPQLTQERTFMSEVGTKDTSKSYKSYVQILKDSKNRSAHLPRTNSFRQKELTLRRYKTRTQVSKHTHTKEENEGFLPDFILTYTNDERVNQQKKIEGGFEWEQTFLFNKPSWKEKTEIQQNIKYGRPSQEKWEPNVMVSDDGRSVVNVNEVDPVSEDMMNEIKAPPTTPAALFTDTKLAITRQNTRMHETETGNDVKSGFEDPCNENSWSTFQRQKTRLARGVTLLSKKAGTTGNFQYGTPITQPKTLTPREAKSPVDGLNQVGITGQGRKLVERSKNFEPANLDDLHSIWTRKSRTASSQRSSINQDHPAAESNNKDLETNDMAIRTVDSNGVLQLPQIVSHAPPVLDIRPPSPPRRTIVDGVTDIIRIQITGSAKH